jgi:hypothetical protein
MVEIQVLFDAEQRRIVFADAGVGLQRCTC